MAGGREDEYGGYSDDDFEEEYSDDDFEEDDGDDAAVAAAPAAPAPAESVSELAEAMAAENARAKERALETQQRQQQQQPQQQGQRRSQHLYQPNMAYARAQQEQALAKPLPPRAAERSEVALPAQRVVKGLPGSGGGSSAGPVSDASRAAARRVAARWAALASGGRLPQLELSPHAEVFALAPRSEAELAARGKGVYAQRRPAGTQTNEEACAPAEREGTNRQARLGRESQTEDVQTATAVAQVPEDASVKTEAGALVDPNAVADRSALSRGSGRDGKSGADARPRATLGSLAGRGAQQMLRLSAFLRRAGRAVEALLEEGAGTGSGQALVVAGDVGRSGVFKMGAKGSLSAACATLRCAPDALAGARRVTDVAYDSHGGALLVAYSRGSAGAPFLPGAVPSHMGAAAVWELRRPSAPAHLLCTQGSPTCACWGSGAQDQLAFAGTDAGSVVVWDTRGSRGRGRGGGKGARNGGKAASGTASQPVYVSDFDQSRNHGGAVVAVAAATWGAGAGEAAGGGGLPGGSFAIEAEGGRAGAGASTGAAGAGEAGPGGLHLVTLDERSVAHVWSVSDVVPDEEASGFADDFGLQPGGTARLVRAATVDLMRGKRAGSRMSTETTSAVSALNRRRTYALALSPADANDFVVASDGGVLLRGAQYGAPPPPRAYGPATSATGAAGASNGAGASGDVTAVSFCPAMASLFAAGCSDGRVALYSKRGSEPVREWGDITRGARVTGVAWLPTRPACFVVLDAEGFTHLMSLTDDPGGPICSERLGAADTAAEGDAASATCVRSSADGSGGSMLAVGYDDGRVDVHLVAPAFASSSSVDLEVEVLESLVEGTAEPL